jgi:hypothetical protein
MLKIELYSVFFAATFINNSHAASFTIEDDALQTCIVQAMEKEGG